MSTQPKPDPSRRAKIRINLDTLRQVLQLPDDVRVISLIPRYDPYQIEVLVTCDRFPQVPAAEESPRLDLGAMVHFVEQDDRTYVALRYPGLEP